MTLTRSFISKNIGKPFFLMNIMCFRKSQTRVFSYRFKKRILCSRAGISSLMKKIFGEEKQVLVLVTVTNCLVCEKCHSWKGMQNFLNYVKLLSKENKLAAYEVRTTPTLKEGSNLAGNIASRKDDMHRITWRPEAKIYKNTSTWVYEKTWRRKGIFKPVFGWARSFSKDMVCYESNKN